MASSVEYSQGKPVDVLPFLRTEVMTLEIGNHSYRIHAGVLRKSTKIKRLLDERNLHERVIQRLSGLLDYAKKFPSFTNTINFQERDFFLTSPDEKTPGSFKGFILERILDRNPDEFEGTYADLRSIIGRVFEGDFNQYLSILEDMPSQTVGKKIDKFTAAFCCELESTTTIAEEYLRICKAQINPIRFPDVDAPVRIVEAVVGAMYTDRVEVVHSGDQWVKPTSLLRYIKISQLAHDLGFEAIKETVITEVYLQKDDLVPSSDVATEVRAYTDEHSINLAQLGLNKLCDAILSSAWTGRNVSITEKEAFQPFMDGSISASPGKERGVGESVKELLYGPKKGNSMALNGNAAERGAGTWDFPEDD